MAREDQETRITQYEALKGKGIGLLAQIQKGNEGGKGGETSGQIEEKTRKRRSMEELLRESAREVEETKSRGVRQ
jgi:hypothetical protein